MKAGELLSRVDYISVAGNSDCMVDAVVCDSRFVRNSSLFVAIPGYQQDGWNYVGSAIENGAVVVVSEHSTKDCLKVEGCDAEKRTRVCFVQVADAKLALAELSSAFYGNPSKALTMIGITGTNGKTTTAYLIYEILKSAGEKPGMLTTVQYDIGMRSIPAARTTPDAPLLHDLLAQMRKVGCQSAVMEVSSHAIVQKRIARIDYDVAVFTNLTRDHLDYHKTMEQYYEAKAELFRNLKPADMDRDRGANVGSPVAVINIDDKWGRKLAADRDISVKVVTYGVAADADVRATDISITQDGSSFTVNTPVGTVSLQIKLLGRFNISNALASIATGISMGINLDLIVRALVGAESVAGRLESIRGGRGPQVFVDYAHTDDALMNVLQTLSEITRGKLFVVFGCGGDRDSSKRPAMGRVAEELSDYAVLTSDNPRTEDPAKIINEIAAAFISDAKYEVIEDRKQAIARAVSLAGDDDVVLVAGKGHENFQVFGNKTLSFDDRQVVRDIVGGES